MSPLEITLDNRLAELPKAHDWFDGIIARFTLPPKTGADLHVALEEHLTNIINYGYAPEQPGRIMLRFHAASNEFHVEIEDDARPFNPLLVPPADVHQPFELRPIGGLGIHLLRRLTDDLRYEHRAGRNCLVLVKRTPG